MLTIIQLGLVSIYLSFQLVQRDLISTYIAATTTRRKASKEGQAGGDVWVSPIMDASKGRLRTNAGRMGRTQGDDNRKKYGIDPYEAV